MTKWGDRPHWEFDGDVPRQRRARRLARHPRRDHDDPARRRLRRAGGTRSGWCPGPGPRVERGWLATFHDEGGPVRVYVDMTTPAGLGRRRGAGGRPRPGRDPGPRRRGCGSTTRTSSREHRVELGYPDEVVGLATASRDRIRDLVARRCGAVRRRCPAVVRRAAPSVRLILARRVATPLPAGAAAAAEHVDRPDQPRAGEPATRRAGPRA